MLPYHRAGTPLLLPQMEKEIGIFAFPPNLIKIRPTGFRANSHLLYLREIHSSPDLEDDDDNEDHGSEGADDDADDKRHCRRHSSLRLHLLRVTNLLAVLTLAKLVSQDKINNMSTSTYSDGIFGNLVHIVLFVVTLFCALLGGVIANGLPVVGGVSRVGKVIKIC